MEAVEQSMTKLDLCRCTQTFCIGVHVFHRGITKNRKWEQANFSVSFSIACSPPSSDPFSSLIMENYHDEHMSQMELEELTRKTKDRLQQAVQADFYDVDEDDARTRLLQAPEVLQSG